MPQTVHSASMPIAHAGQLADNSMIKDVISRLAETASGIRAGIFVVPGTDAEKQAVAPTAAAEITDGDGLGVVLYDASKMPATTAVAVAVDAEYDDDASLPILSKGRVWVLCDAAATIVANTPAFVRRIAGAGEVLGAFREDVDGGDADALPNAVFRSAHTDVVFQADTIRIALLSIAQPTT